MGFGRIPLAAAALLSLGTAATAQDLGGRYSIDGTAVDGSKYTGTVELVETSASTCRITWWVGRQTFRGICMRLGNTFAASYTYKRTSGLVIYEINPDKTLSGLWTIADKEGVGSEVLTKMK